MKHRVYYAITFDAKTIDQLTRYTDIIKETASQCKITPAACLHMTLAFIGETEELDLLKSIRQEMTFSPFSFDIDHIGAFDDAKGSHLYFAATSHDDELYALQKQLTDQLKARQISFHDRLYLPHITLSRKTLLKQPLPAFPTIHVAVSSFHLLESVPYQNTRIGIIIDD